MPKSGPLRGHKTQMKLYLHPSRDSALLISQFDFSISHLVLPAATRAPVTPNVDRRVRNRSSSMTRRFIPRWRVAQVKTRLKRSINNVSRVSFEAGDFERGIVERRRENAGRWSHRDRVKACALFISRACNALGEPMKKKRRCIYRRPTLCQMAGSSSTRDVGLLITFVAFFLHAAHLSCQDTMPWVSCAWRISFTFPSAVGCE